MWKKITVFEWDEGNRDKNKKHKVEWHESEEVFFNQPLLIALNPRHSQQEVRFQALGKTNFGRLLFISFTVRRHKVRIISARDQSRKERSIYEKASQKAT